MGAWHRTRISKTEGTAITITVPQVPGGRGQLRIRSTVGLGPPKVEKGPALPTWGLGTRTVQSCQVPGPELVPGMPRGPKRRPRPRPLAQEETERDFILSGAVFNSLDSSGELSASETPGTSCHSPSLSFPTSGQCGPYQLGEASNIPRCCQKNTAWFPEGEPAQPRNRRESSGE